LSTLKKLLKAHSKTGGGLVTPRYEHYLAQHSNILVDETIGEFVKSELTTPQRNRRMTFSASARGTCPRAQVFKFTSLRGVPRFSTDLIAIFHQGTFMHLKWQALLLDAGILDECEVTTSIEQYNLSGTVDGTGLVPDDHALREQHTRFGWELKSINSRGFQWVLDKGPKRDHLLQIHAYMLGTGWRIWSLMYENKDTQQYKEFIVDFDPRIAEEVELELQYLNEHVEDKKLPPILSECKKKQGAFKSCEFAHSCLEQRGWPQKRIKL
jgi:hypothetical protein